ncbi:MAG: hypothetical protein L0241_27840 [Planctomycetia bacterium]|nr:hypothetical protein [Planctomycetia bacterium]
MAKQKTAKAPPASATHFVVSRVNWRVAGMERVFVRLPGDVRVSAFDTVESAEADRASREAAARKLVNPFQCGLNWSDRSHLPEAVFRDFIKDAGIEPPTIVPVEIDPDAPRQVRRKLKKEKAAPEGAFPDWAAWWEATEEQLSAEQHARVWEGLDRVRFFQVEERPKRTVVFAVVEIAWNYNDEWYYPEPEGGAAHTAYRTRERAEVECERMNAEAREQWRRNLHLPALGVEPVGEGYEAFPFDMQDRPFPGEDPFAPKRQPPARPWEDRKHYSHGKFGVDEVPFYEVIEFELPEGE